MQKIPIYIFPTTAQMHNTLHRTATKSWFSLLKEGEGFLSTLTIINWWYLKFLWYRKAIDNRGKINFSLLPYDIIVSSAVGLLNLNHVSQRSNTCHPRRFLECCIALLQYRMIRCEGYHTRSGGARLKGTEWRPCIPLKYYMLPGTRGRKFSNGSSDKNFHNERS